MINVLKQLITGNAKANKQLLLNKSIQKTTPKAHLTSDCSPKPETANLRRAKLIMVTPQNNNKYYEMVENADSTFTVEYGRIGSHGTTRSYPIEAWESKKREKIRKGYSDMTHLFTKQRELTAFLKIEDATTRQLIKDLSWFARKSIFANYNVSAAEVTMNQVNEAQAILDQLSDSIKKRMRIKLFNQRLTQLFAVIPRRMTKVQDHLIVKGPKTAEDFEALERKIAEEQATLDVMRGQVELLEKQDEQPVEKQTILEAFGMSVSPVEDAAVIGEIKKMMGAHKQHFKKAYQVINHQTQLAFDTHLEESQNKSTELFWHGSRNENWLSILKNGLKLRPANAIINGKMFGYGLYFADKFAKSLNYSSLSGSYWTGGRQSKGFLALYEVHIGKQLKISLHKPWCYELNEANLKAQGAQYDSLYAKGGYDLRNNEYIIYNQNQSTIKYLIEIN